jgi:tRNA A58 N-methylase Trm61
MILERVVKRTYNRVLRPLLPRKIASFNGVPVRQPRLLDTTDVRPDHEDALVSEIMQQVRQEDDIVVVGEGWGIRSVYATRQAGADGQVTVFEGGSEQVDHVREILELSRANNRVGVRHAVVGPDEEVYGQTDQAQFIDPAELPTCDVFVLDCEGTETAILEGISHRPRTIIVETHHMYGAPVSKVRAVLGERGMKWSANVWKRRCTASFQYTPPIIGAQGRKKAI